MKCKLTLEEIDQIIRLTNAGQQSALKTGLETGESGYGKDYMRDYGDVSGPLGDALTALEETVMASTTDPDTTRQALRLLEDARIVYGISAYIHGRTVGARETARLLLGRDLMTQIHELP